MCFNDGCCCKVRLRASRVACIQGIRIGRIGIIHVTGLSDITYTQNLRSRNKYHVAFVKDDWDHAVYLKDVRDVTKLMYMVSLGISGF